VIGIRCLSAAEAGWREKSWQESERELRVRSDGRDATLPGRRLLDCRKSGASHTARAESSIRVVARKTIGHHTLLRDAADGLKPWKKKRNRNTDNGPGSNLPAAVAGTAGADVFSV